MLLRFFHTWDCCSIMAQDTCWAWTQNEETCASRLPKPKCHQDKEPVAPDVVGLAFGT
jgi:hypothetical protein